MISSKLNALLQTVEKPARYLGNEINSIHKDFDKAEVRICLIFPDKYEIGMSHIGLKILYDILNSLPHVVAERCFSPDMDLQQKLKDENIPLFSLESKRPLKDFDILGFSLTYELTYVNMLKILELAQIPLWQKDRGDKDPLILAGGGCCMNAEPFADFVDAAALGDGEELILDVVEAVRKWKIPSPLRGEGQGEGANLNLTPPSNSLPQVEGGRRSTLLDSLSTIEGIYIPSFFEPVYNEDQTIKEMRPLKPGYERINKRIVKNIDTAPYPTKILVPNVKPVHDRIGIEIQRGCNRFCRFCQAGYIDRPVRQRSPETILKIAEDSYQQTGIDEISLLSLSAADYGCIVPLLAEMNSRYADRRVSLSVPATRTEKMTPELAEQIKKVRKTGFTIAPEAGSERMRRVINKGNKVDDLHKAVHTAFSAGWTLMKMYYMVGLPFENEEDVLGIANESRQCLEIAMKYTGRAELNTSCSSFVPKPFTPFQWEPQMTAEQTKKKYDLVRYNLGNKRIRLKTHHPEMSYLEGIFSRGDRRVSDLLIKALEAGCGFDEWAEHFDFRKWQDAISRWNMSPDFYLHRKREKSEVLPWDHLFAQMDKNFLWDEWEKASEAAMSSPQMSKLEGGDPELDQTEQNMASRPKSSPMAGMTASAHPRPFKKRLPSLPSYHDGFSEDCSTHRCSNCGVCDFKDIKNRIYVPLNDDLTSEPQRALRGRLHPAMQVEGATQAPIIDRLVAKKGHREWYGWERQSLVTSDSSPIKNTSHQPLATSPISFKSRFRFTKRNDARFLSHLEIMGAFKRALTRVQIPIRYSEGFHPQMKLAMSHPLSLGIESDWEFFEIETFKPIDPQELKDRLNEGLPGGIVILDAETVDTKAPSLYSRLRSVDYEANFESLDDLPENALATSLSEYQKKDQWIWSRFKEGKRKDFDLKKLVSVKGDNLPRTFQFSTRIDPDGSLKPQEVLCSVLGLTPEMLHRVRIVKQAITWGD